MRKEEVCEGRAEVKEREKYDMKRKERQII
jgi:hypothetical protein